MGSIQKHTNDGLRKICGCPRRIWAKCDHSWHFNFRWQGVPHRYSLDKLLQRSVRSKTEATIEADRIREAIKAGTFDVAKQAPGRFPTLEQLTLDSVGAIYLERFSKARDKKTWANDAHMLRQLGAFLLDARSGPRLPFGGKTFPSITGDDVKLFLRDLKTRGRAASTRNQYLQLVTSLFRWATKNGYLTRNPIADLELRREKIAKRSRRLEPGEEHQLLTLAGPRLWRLIVAALETCCRAGELLKLQWRHVNLVRGEIRIVAANAKDAEDRYLPISIRLRAVLDMVTHDPAGRRHGPDAFVFGNELGEEAPFPKKTWDTIVLKAHGHEPQWEKGKGKLTPASRAELTAIDLHFHDLRHEAGSRLLEAGWPLHHVQEMLGHANISQTDTYLNAERIGLHESMRRKDAEFARTLQESANLAQAKGDQATQENTPKRLIN